MSTDCMNCSKRNMLNFRKVDDMDGESIRVVNRLKNTNAAKFETMCKMHLSFLLHLDGDQLQVSFRDNFQIIKILPPIYSSVGNLFAYLFPIRNSCLRRN